jgi:hypothetical protein
MTGNSRSNNGVASLAYVPGTHVFPVVALQGVDARDKPGHDRKSRHLFLNFAGRFSTKAAMPSF